ncbi:MAG TPA: SH3 domain-containing protein [Polyangiaceae bacterium]
MSVSNRKRPKEPNIVVPRPSDERPRFARIGVIAAIGFVIGVAWPGLTQVHLVPQPPSEAPPGASASAAVDPLLAQASNAVPGDASGALGAVTAPLGPNQDPSSAREQTGASAKQTGPRVRLADIISCVDADGKKRQKCDAPALDPVLVEPLKGLLACDGVEGNTGSLSIGFDIDLGSGNLSHFTAGRSTTLDAALAHSVLECAKGKLTHVDVSNVEHAYAHYRVFYIVEFQRSSDAGKRRNPQEPSEQQAAQAPTGTEGELQGQSGRATVTWDVAIVRQAPKDGALVARVLGGTRVIVTGRQGDWYRIKYNAKGDEGFVFKSAIGL